MQKWHINSAIGRGRPLSPSIQHQYLFALSGSHFHNSTTQLQNDGRDSSLQGPATPSSTRGKRLLDTSAEIQNLYLRSTANGNPTSRSKNIASEAILATDGRNDKVAAIDARNLGVPLSKDVLEGNARGISGRLETRTDSSYLGRQSAQESTGGAVDARSLGAIANGGREAGRFTITRLPFNLPLARSPVPITPTERPAETMGLPERQRFPPRAVRGESAGERERPIRQPTTASGIKERTPRFGSNFPAQVEGSDGQRVFRRPGAGGRPKRSGGSAGGGPGRRRRGDGSAGGGGGRDRGPPVEIWDAEEKEYFEDKSEREAVKAMNFEPELSKAKLNSVRPAVASGPQGMSVMLGDRLVLARKYLNKEFIQWDSKEQKADVMTLVEKLKNERQAKSNNEEGERSSTPPEVLEQTNALVEKLWGGKYEMVKSKKRSVSWHVKRHTIRNESYYPEDEKSLLKKVKALLPAEQPAVLQGA